MKKSNQVIAIIVAIVVLVFSLSGCRQSDRVTYNLSKDADNFKIIRQVTIINCIQGDVLFQMTGRMSVEGGSEGSSSSTGNDELIIIVQTSETTFKKHFIGLSDNVTYIVEQIETADVDNYSYTLVFNPNMWLPIKIEVGE